MRTRQGGVISLLFFIHKIKVPAWDFQEIALRNSYCCSVSASSVMFLPTPFFLDSSSNYCYIFTSVYPGELGENDERENPRIRERDDEGFCVFILKVTISKRTPCTISFAVPDISTGRSTGTCRRSKNGGPMKNAIVILFFSLLLYACKDNSTDSSLSSQFITASQRNGAVNTYANSYHAGLRLLSISTTNIGTDGKASQWSYCYVDTSLGEHPTYYFHATANEVFFDSTAPLLIGPSIITLRWFDSDSALVFAELNGGAQYRTLNPNTTITASLGQSLSPNPVTSWRIIYQSSSIALGLIIDANTGTVLGQTK